MSDPKRFLQGRRGELETELLQSVRDDGPSPDARARTLRALGLGGVAFGTTAITTAAGSTAAATSAVAAATSGMATSGMATSGMATSGMATSGMATSGMATAAATAGVGSAAKIAGFSAFAVASKWLAVGVGTGVLTVALAHPIAHVVQSVAGGTWAAMGSASPPVGRKTPSSFSSSTYSSAPPVLPRSAGRASDEQPRDLPETEAVQLPRVAPASSVLAPAGRAVRSEDARRADVSLLPEEIGALDRARSVAVRDPAEALRLLDLYDQQYPRGHLAPEARVLRIEVLAGSGKTERAVALAREVLRMDPYGPHAQKVRSLLTELAGP